MYKLVAVFIICLVLVGYIVKRNSDEVARIKAELSKLVNIIADCTMHDEETKQAPPPKHTQVSLPKREDTTKKDKLNAPMDVTQTAYLQKMQELYEDTSMNDLFENDPHITK